MGSSPSKKPNATLRKFELTGKCPKHGHRVYTHFCEETSQLMCLACHLNYQRSRVRRGNVTCQEIGEYFQSFNFKRKQTKVEEELRMKQKNLEEEISEMERHCRALQGKGERITETVSSYVNTITELLKHMSEDICKDARKLVQGEVDVISRQITDVKKDLGNIETHLQDLQQTKSLSLSPEVQVSTTVKADTSVKHIPINRYEIVPTHVNLALNTGLKLSDIAEATKASQAVLGTVRLHKGGDLKTEMVDDVSDDVSDESAGQRTARSSPEHSKEAPNRTHGRVEAVAETQNSSHKSIGDETDQAVSSALLAIKESTSEDMDDKKAHSTELDKPSRPVSQQHKQPTCVDKGNGRRTPLRNQHSTPAVLGPPGRKSSLGASRVVRSSLSRISPLSPTTPSAITFGTPRPSVPLWTKQPVKVQEITLPQDKTTSNITGSIILRDGKIILVDQKNSKLKLFDANFDLLDELSLPGQPHNIANDSHGRERIAVTLPGLHTVKMFRLENGKLAEEAEDDVYTGPQCWGVEFISGKLAYTTDRDAVFRREDQGFLKFPYSFSEPVSLHADCRSKVLYVCCNGLKNYSGSVVAMDFSGEIQFTYSNKDLRHPLSIALDREGNIYVVDREPHAVHLLTSDGHYGKVILDQREGHFQHIRFFPNTDTFLVSEKDSDKVTIYQMQ